MKIFLTGDNHFGRRYDRYPDVKEKLIDLRMESFRSAVDAANRDGCDFFVIAGDLFDRISGIDAKTVRDVVTKLGEFEGTAVVLPGNHDYYDDGHEMVWKTFDEAVRKAGAGNIVLMNRFRPYEMDAGGEKVTFYPAFCEAKHSEKNNLGWIKDEDLKSKEGFRVGVAHGAIEGITPDRDQQYFLMSIPELEAIPVDVWLIGHTHVPYPRDLEEQFAHAGKIFNAGTHEQTDLSCNTDGECFEILLERKDGGTDVRARKIVTGNVRFADETIVLNGGDDPGALADALGEKTAAYGDNTVLRLRIKGVVSSEEYDHRNDIYREKLGRFLTYEIEDSGLSERITTERIRSEFPELSFAAAFLEALEDDPKEEQMAYELIRNCRE